MLTDLMHKYKKAGWFDNYPINHIVYPALKGENVKLEENDNEFIFGIKGMYSTFIANFLKTLLYMQANFDSYSNEWIVRQYLACEHNYTNNEFLVRYSNVLVMCGFKTFNMEVQQCQLQRMDNITIMRLKFADGIVLQFYSGVLDRGKIGKTLVLQNVLELEVGLKVRDIEQLQNRASDESIYMIPPYIQQIVNELSKVDNLPEDENTYNVCLLHLLADNIEGNNIFPVKGMLLNKYTGLFVNDMLHEEYHYNNCVSKGISGILVVRYNLEFFLYGDIRYLLDDKHHFFSTNKVGRKCNKSVYPFISSNYSEKIMGIYNPASVDIVERYNFYISLMLENYKKALSPVFTNKERLLLQCKIQTNLKEVPQLLSPFGLSIHEATKEIYKRYELMYEIIKEKYPRDHPFQNKEFLFDAMSFSLAYCMYIVPKYLNNLVMIDDFLKKKFICKKDGLFNRKVFNESYSEFEIFFYLFVGIFCNSDRYKSFLKLDYEPSGNHNKRFEYAFIFKDYRINIEVKALECAPEDIDNINLLTMENGTRFYKNYFHAYDENDVIPAEILKNAKKLKSNYRQVSKNIKKIKEKCVEDERVINLGFLMINYGTSREEYISYLMHSEQGYLRKNPLDKLDALILFSMCMNTDLLMENILEKEHIFVFANAKKDNSILLSDLRLNNYVCEGENKYAVFFDDMYGEYIGIRSGGIVTIQGADVKEADWNQEQNVMSQIENGLQELVNLSK